MPNILARDTAINSQSYNRVSEERIGASQSIGKKMPSSQKPAGSNLDDTLNNVHDVVFFATA